jgi:hypothetical protein
MPIPSFVFRAAPLALTALLFFSACNNDDNDDTEPLTDIAAPVLLVIDEESIDNGNEPNQFSASNVNDNLARVGLRESLKYFRENVGETILLYTGQVGDEGWHALKTIPATWKNAGPTSNGARNFLQAGPGLGSGNDDTEVLLDKIPEVTPLRATGLAMLKGQIVLAVVYDGDVSVNYGPLLGNLQGANLGLVALEVLDVTERTDGSSSDLPSVRVRIRDVNDALAGIPHLFSNAPAPESSSEPFDIKPPAIPQAAVLLPAP